MSKDVLDFISLKISEKNKAISVLRSSIKGNKDQIDAWQKELDGYLKDIADFKTAKDKIEKP